MGTKKMMDVCKCGPVVQLLILHFGSFSQVHFKKCVRQSYGEVSNLWMIFNKSVLYWWWWKWWIYCCQMPLNLYFKMKTELLIKLMNRLVLQGRRAVIHSPVARCLQVVICMCIFLWESVHGELLARTPVPFECHLHLFILFCTSPQVERLN